MPDFCEIKTNDVESQKYKNVCLTVYVNAYGKFSRDEEEKDLSLVWFDGRIFEDFYLYCGFK